MPFGRRYFAIPSRNLTGYSGYATDWGAPLFASAPPDDALPCDPVTVASFRERLPVFSVVNGFTDALVQQALDDAGLRADSTWTSCEDYRQAVAYLAAHYLFLNALAAAEIPEDDGSGGFIAGGDVTSVAFETMRVSFSASKLGASGGGIGRNGWYDLSATPYGQRYLDLLKVNVPAILVI
jgi:hypothetical protein